MDRPSPDILSFEDYRVQIETTGVLTAGDRVLECVIAGTLYPAAVWVGICFGWMEDVPLADMFDGSVYASGVTPLH